MSVRTTLVGMLRSWTTANDAAPETPDAVADAYRSEVLNEAADRFDSFDQSEAASLLRKMADRTI